MVGSTHEALHRIFQEDPGVFARTFRRLGVPFADPVRAHLFSPDLSEVRPVERRADTLLRFDGRDGRSFLLVIEAQSKKDPQKPGSWAYYLSYLRAKYAIETTLLVVCHSARTAKWAAGPFTLGPPEWPPVTLRPLVLGPHNVPKVKDAATAVEDIPLATLAAVTHALDPSCDAILQALAAALKTVDSDTATLFAELTELGLGATPAKDVWRKLMTIDLSFFRSETSQALREEGRALGRQEGLQEGMQEGLQEGRLAGLTEMLLAVVRDREIALTESERDRITSCDSPETLLSWALRADSAATGRELFGDS